MIKAALLAIAHLLFIGPVAQGREWRCLVTSDAPAEDGSVLYLSIAGGDMITDHGYGPDGTRPFQIVFPTGVVLWGTRDPEKVRVLNRFATNDGLTGAFERREGGKRTMTGMCRPVAQGDTD